MAQLKKLTASMKKMLVKHKLDPNEWMLKKDLGDHLLIVNKLTSKEKILEKVEVHYG